MTHEAAKRIPITALDNWISKYVELIASMLCIGRCAVRDETLTTLQDYRDDYREQGFSYGPHNKGGIYQLLFDGDMLDQDHFNRWVNDIQHGLLHGFFVGLLGLLDKYWPEFPDHLFRQVFEKELGEDETIIITALIHDYFKAVTGEHDAHDRKLRIYFDRLCTETYTHTNPPIDHENHPLIIGDRFELRRFERYNEWCKPHLISSRNSEIIDLFFEYYRPAIRALYEHRHDIWLRHSPEYPLSPRHPEIFPGTFGTNHKVVSEEFYPSSYWEGLKNHWCVEIGELPLRGCVVHSHIEHGSYVPYGIISIHTLRKYSSGRLRHVPRRDHFAISGEVPIEEWVFLFVDDDDLTGELLNLILKGKGIISLSLANKTIRTLQRLENLFRVGRCM